MRKSDFIWAMLILTGTTTFVFANAYKWENNGQVEYSQEPPPGVEATKITPPPPPPPSSAPNQTKGMNATPDPLKKGEATKTQDEALKQYQEQDAAIRKTNCDQFQQYLKNMESKARIKLIDSQGNAVLLSQEQRNEEIEKAKEGIKTWCNP